MFAPLVLAQPYTIVIKGGVSLNEPNPPANTWWITASGAGNLSGTSLANAGAIGTFSFVPVNYRDTVYFCGNFNQAINPSTLGSGLPGYPITLDSSCPGGTPAVFDGANVVTGWTSVSSNVYSTPLASGSGPWVSGTGSYGTAFGGIVTEDDVALIAVPFITNIATTIPNMVSTTSTFSLGSWTYDNSNGILYVLTTDASSPSGHTIEASYGQNFSTLFNLSGKSNITIQNMTIKNAGDYGVDIPNGTNIIFANNAVYNIDNWGLIAANEINMTTSSNAVHNVVWTAHSPSPSEAVGEGIRYDGGSGGSIFGNTVSYDPSAGIDLHGGVTGVKMYSNVIHDNIGMSTFYSSGIYLDNAQGNFIYGNEIYNEMVGINLNGENTNSSSSGNYVYNNLVYNWYYTGSYLGGSEGWVSSQNNFWYNNTFVVGPSQDGSGGQAIAIQNSVDDTFQNNIVYGNVYSYSAGGQTFAPGYFDYNQYYNTTFGGSYNSYSAWQTATQGETHSANSSPSIGSVFVGSSIPPATNFELVGGSPALNVGTNLSFVFTTNYAGSSRPSSGAWNAGAY